MQADKKQMKFDLKDANKNSLIEYFVKKFDESEIGKSFGLHTQERSL
jgi:hypothetical protein